MAARVAALEIEPQIRVALVTRRALLHHKETMAVEFLEPLNQIVAAAVAVLLLLVVVVAGTLQQGAVMVEMAPLQLFLVCLLPMLVAAVVAVEIPAVAQVVVEQVAAAMLL
jgi:hypothetical protein